MTDHTNPPYAEEWLAAEAIAGGRFVCTGDVHSIRSQFNTHFGSIKSLIPPPDYRVSKSDLHTPENVSVRVYEPVSLDSSAPTGLYIHSGGWACGSIEHEDHLCRQLALDVPCRLVSVEYRLAPEHPFPAALEDCTSAYKWMVSNAAFPSDRFFIVGGSAGGNLTLTTALKLLDDRGTALVDEILRPKALFSLCPSVCLSQATGELEEECREFVKPDEVYADSAAISKEVCWTCGEAYAGSSSPAHPLISPIFHRKLANLPPVYTTTSDKDPLNDDAEMLNHKLTSLGVDCTIKRYPGYPHFFHVLPMLRMTRTFNEDLATAIREKCCDQESK